MGEPPARVRTRYVCARCGKDGGEPLGLGVAALQGEFGFSDEVTARIAAAIVVTDTADEPWLCHACQHGVKRNRRWMPPPPARPARQSTPPRSARCPQCGCRLRHDAWEEVEIYLDRCPVCGWNDVVYD